MPKHIIFDGDFHEAELDWLEERKGAEDYDEWLERAGFRKTPYDVGAEYGLRVMQIYRNEKKDAWHVVVTTRMDEWCAFTVEGHLNKLRFLSSGLCSQDDVYQHIAALRATVGRAFQAWHGHEAPEDENDHSLRGSCDECDPGWTETRRREREALHKWAREQAARKHEKEAGNS